MNIGGHTFFLIGVLGFLGYIPTSGITGSNGSFIFNFLRKLHTVFHNGSPVDIPTSNDLGRVRFSPHAHQHLSFVDLLMVAILTGVR